MKKEFLVLYDEDEDYVQSFTSYVNSLSNATFSVAGFTNYENLINHISKQKDTVIILPEPLLEERCEELSDRQLIILGDENYKGIYNDLEVVFKYQSGDDIIREISRICSEKSSINMRFLSGRRRDDTKIYGVYSPVRRCGSTLFSITSSQIIGENQRVLYLNFDDNSVVNKIFDCDKIGDLSDLLFYYMHEYSNMPLKLSSVVVRFGNFDFVPPIENCSDIRNISMDVWKDFLRDIGKWGNYDVLILDIGETFSEVIELFEICDKVYMPYLKDDISLMKLERFEEYIDISEEDILREKIFKILMTDNGFDDDINFDINRCMYGTYREFVKSNIWDVVDVG